jgi:hypothetical protein
VAADFPRGGASARLLPNTFRNFNTRVNKRVQITRFNLASQGIDASFSKLHTCMGGDKICLPSLTS